MTDTFTWDVPVGIIAPYAGAAIPSGWLECNGQSCASYPALVTLLGGSTVPDLRDRYVRGWGSSAPKSTGGTWKLPLPEHNHGGRTSTQLDISTLAPKSGVHSHTLPVGDSPHPHGRLTQMVQRYRNPEGTGTQVQILSQVVDPAGKLTSKAGNHNHGIKSVTTDHTHKGFIDVGQGNDYEPSYIALLYMIKAV